MEHRETTTIYLGDGLYARLEHAHMITLHTDRYASYDGTPIRHWVALEPDVFLALLKFACVSGWGGIVDRVAEERRTKP